jgi:hypothetical protein
MVATSFGPYSTCVPSTRVLPSLRRWLAQSRDRTSSLWRPRRSRCPFPRRSPAVEASTSGQLRDLAGYEPPTSTRILPSLTSYFARSSASASESTLIAACGWRALIARIALLLSGMPTRHHSCSGEPPPGFGSTVTIFHPVVMRRSYPSPFEPARREPARQLTAPCLARRAPRLKPDSLLSRSIERSVKSRKNLVALLGHRRMTGSKSKNRMPTPVEANDHHRRNARSAEEFAQEFLEGRLARPLRRRRRIKIDR